MYWRLAHFSRHPFFQFSLFSPCCCQFLCFSLSRLHSFSPSAALFVCFRNVYTYMNPKVVKKKWNANGPMLKSKKKILFVYCVMKESEREWEKERPPTPHWFSHNAEQASSSSCLWIVVVEYIHKTICVIECVSVHLSSNPFSLQLFIIIIFLLCIWRGKKNIEKRKLRA